MKSPLTYPPPPKKKEWILLDVWLCSNGLILFFLFKFVILSQQSYCLEPVHQILSTFFLPAMLKRKGPILLQGNTISYISQAIQQKTGAVRNLVFHSTLHNHWTFLFPAIRSIYVPTSVHQCRSGLKRPSSTQSTPMIPVFILIE